MFGILLVGVTWYWESGETSHLHCPNFIIVLILHLLLQVIFNDSVENDDEEDEENTGEEPQVQHLDVGGGGQRRGTLKREKVDKFWRPKKGDNEAQYAARFRREGDKKVSAAIPCMKPPRIHVTHLRKDGGHDEE